MTNPTVLADALVEAGILKDRSGGVYEIIGQGGREYLVTAKEAITDWRVAGKVLFRLIIICGHTRGLKFSDIMKDVLEKMEELAAIPDDSHFARAIIEAWYEARQ